MVPMPTQYCPRCASLWDTQWCLGEGGNVPSVEENSHFTSGMLATVFLLDTDLSTAWEGIKEFLLWERASGTWASESQRGV